MSKRLVKTLLETAGLCRQFAGVVDHLPHGKKLRHLADKIEHSAREIDKEGKRKRCALPNALRSAGLMK